MWYTLTSAGSVGARVASRAVAAVAVLTFAQAGVAIASPHVQVQNGFAGADPLVPLSEYLTPAEFGEPQISPDGKHLVFLAPVAGVANLMMARTDAPAIHRALTHDTGRGFQGRTIWGERTVRWSYDNRHLLYLRDDRGDENWVLYCLDTVTGQTRRLSPARGVRVRGLQLSARHPDKALFAMNDRDPRTLDYYTVEIATGKLEHIASAAPYDAKLFDDDFRERVGLKIEPDQSWNLDRRQPDGAWVRFAHLMPQDASMMYEDQINNLVEAAFSEDGTKLVTFSSAGLNTNALVQYDLQSGKRTVIGIDPRVDVKRAIVDPRTGAPQAYVSYWTRPVWKVLDPALKPDFAALRRLDSGDIEIESRSLDDRVWVVSFMHSDYPTRYFLYNRTRHRSVLLGLSSPQLAKMKLSRLRPFVTKSSDGFALVSYIAYPSWVKLNAQGVPDKPLPTITYVHGGPSDERPEGVFAPLVQWLTNRGYIFFYADFRGSPGFGKAFMNAQRHEWGGAMNRDVVEQVQTLVERGIADPKRIAIFGGSYGGYETLIGMTKSPGVFACGAEMVGPSNLQTFIDPSTMPPDWNADSWYALLGDPRTPEGRKLLYDRSPINFVDQVRGSMLIVQGANDVRVPTRQSASMAKKLAQRGIPVTYLLYPDEGHGLIRSENNASFYAIAEVFFGRCLGGRYLPIGRQLEGSSVEVPIGVDGIPGLKGALAARVTTGLPKVGASQRRGRVASSTSR